MKLPAFLVIIVFTIISCDNKPPQYLFPYEWKDSIIDHQLTHDSLVLIFPKKPVCNKWYIEYGVPHDRIGMPYNNGAIPTFHIRNNRIAIAVDVPDSIHTDSLYIYLRAAPADGLHFEKRPGGYSFFVPPSYLQKAHRHHAHPDVRTSSLFWMPDSLLYGADSAYYDKKLQEFLRDSIWQHDPLPAAPGQI